MMDRGIVRAVENFVHAGYPTEAAAVLLVEVDGLEAAVEAQAARDRGGRPRARRRHVRVAADEAERALLWKGRKSAFGAIAQIAPHYHLHDCVVPRTKLAEVLAGVYAIAKHHHLIVTNVFHAGDGNLHPLFSFDLSVPGTIERVLAAADELVRLCVEAGGAPQRRARHRPGEARLHAAGLHGRGSERAGVRALGVRPRRADEPAQGAARRRAMWRLRGSSVGARRRAPGGHMDLIHPHTPGEVADTVRAASADGTRLLIVGGRTHMDKGNPAEIDAELWTTSLDRPVAYDPAEMLCVVEAGVRIHDLAELLAEGGQEWPVDAPRDATVGGVIAADAALPRQLRVGTLRDTVVEMVVVTGDGRRVRSGARTVKNVTGFDLHRLLTGSLGTLGVITQVALKVRPLPKAARTVVSADGGLELGRRILEEVPLPAAVLASPDHVVVRLEGWPEEVVEQASVLGGLTSFHDEDAFPPALFPDAPIVAEAAVAPSRLPALLADVDDFRASIGVGLAWVPCADAEGLARLRERAAELGGIAPVVRGPGGLGDQRLPAPEIQRRIKAAFDPAHILAPGRLDARRTTPA